jgi:hypothetical protein
MYVISRWSDVVGLDLGSPIWEASEVKFQAHNQTDNDWPKKPAIVGRPRTASSEHATYLVPHEYIFG